MRGDFDEDETDDDYYEVMDDDDCPECAGEGVILTCIDDMCRGIGECIHGDGYSACPSCYRRARADR